MIEVITLETVKESIRNVPDFPNKGINFKDLTTTFKQADLLSFLVEEISKYYSDKKITHVAGIESRGFIIGAALANRLNAGFIPIRKPGKLPAEIYSKKYYLEYGEDSVEMHKDALSNNDIVLLHDDLLATGGTANAAIDLIKMTGVKNIFVNFIVELEFLNGRDKIGNEFDIYTLIKY